VTGTDVARIEGNRKLELVVNNKAAKARSD
jgi:hypothetical protein